MVEGKILGGGHQRAEQMQADAAAIGGLGL